MLVLVITGAVTWMVIRSRSSETHKTPPSLQAVLDLSNLGGNLMPAPIDSKGSALLASDKLRMMRVVSDGRESMIAADISSTSGLPVWQTPIPDELVGTTLDCQLAQDVLDCGDFLRIDLTTGINQVAKSGMTSAAAPSADPSEAPSAPSQGTAPGAGTAPGTDTTPGTDATPGTDTPSGAATTPGATTAPEASASAAPASNASVRLGESASDVVPLAVSADGVLTADGTAVKGLTLDGAAPVWAARVDVPRKLGGVDLPATRQVWVVSDGATMAAVDGSTLLWSITLPEGAAALNGLGAQVPPRWLVSRDAIVVAHPDAVVAVDPADGDTVWRVDGAVTSWFASGDTVVVFNGSTMSLLSFDSGSEPATALPTSAPAAGGALALSPDDLRNSTLEVPDGRCSSAGSKDPSTGAAMAAFVDGVATETLPDGVNGIPSTATMIEVLPGVFDGSPVMLAVLTCAGGNSGSSTVVAYDADKALIGSVDRPTDNSNYLADPLIENLRSVGNTVIYTMPHIQAAGDGYCHACRGSAEATITAQWDGDSLDIVDVLYRLPSGAVRVPTAQDVQVAYDAIASGDDAAAADLVDQEVLDKLNGHVGLDRPSPSNTVRAAQFPEGGRVVECKLAGPAETTYNPPGTDLPQGSIVCPVTTDDPAKPWLQPRVDQYGTKSYVSWLVLRADETGAYTVIDIGRAFE